MKNISFETWLAICIVCLLFTIFTMTGFSQKAIIKKKIEPNILRRSILRTIPASLLGGLCMGMGYASLFKLWEIDQWTDILFAVAVVIGVGVILNIVLWSLLLLSISSATTIYGKDAPKIVKRVVKSLLKLN